MARFLHVIDPEKAKDFFEAQMAFVAGARELGRLIESGDENIRVIDVRPEEEYSRGHLPGAESLPENRWSSLSGLQRDKTNVLYSDSIYCLAAKRAAAYFAARGFAVKELLGGFQAWRELALPVENSGTKIPKTSRDYPAPPARLGEG